MDEKEQQATQPTQTKPPAKPRSRWRRWLSNLAVLFGGFAVAFVLAEIILRSIYYFPQPQFLKPDKIVGHRHRPAISGYYVDEGFSHYSINSHGMRDREYALEKLAGVFRIAVLGDSYTEALQVDLDETFHERLERSLTNVEVLNFGVSGFGTAQELLTYKQYARPFDPDLVLLVVCTGNDIADNSRELSGGYPRPYFHLVDDALALDDDFRRSRRHRLLERYGPIYYFVTDHSALAQRLDRWRRVAMTRARHEKKVEGARRDPEQLEPGLAAGIYTATPSAEVIEAWLIMERLIGELRSAVADDGSTLAIVLTTSAAQVDPKQRALMLQEHPGWDLDYPNQRVREIAREVGSIPCLDLVPPLLERGMEGIQLHGFDGESRGHWNADGHRAAAEELREFLIEHGLIPKGSHSDARSWGPPWDGLAIRRGAPVD